MTFVRKHLATQAPMDLQMSLWRNATLFSPYLLFLWPKLMCKWLNKVLLGPIAPLLQYLMPPPQPRELGGGWTLSTSRPIGMGTWQLTKYFGIAIYFGIRMHFIHVKWIFIRFKLDKIPWNLWIGVMILGYINQGIFLCKGMRGWKILRREW